MVVCISITAPKAFYPTEVEPVEEANEVSVVNKLRSNDNYYDTVSNVDNSVQVSGTSNYPIFDVMVSNLLDYMSSIVTVDYNGSHFAVGKLEANFKNHLNVATNCDDMDVNIYHPRNNAFVENL